MSTLLGDIRFAIRMWLKSPGFAAIAVFTAALGIGANVAIFSVVNAVLIRALPFSNSGALFTISETHPQNPKIDVAYQDFLDWKARSHAFEQMAVYSRFVPTYVLNENGQPEQLQAQGATADCFPMLGVRPLYGRIFTAAEDREGANHYTLLSESLWRRRFGSDPTVVGRSIHLNNELYQVVGVLPEASTYPPATDLWVPFTNVDAGNRENRMYHAASVVARLRPDVSREQAQREVSAIAKGLESEYPRSNRTIGALVEPLREQYAGNVRVMLLVLLGASGLVLLIACANIANLLVARAFGRQSEISIRAALGARRSRLLRQFLTESLLLSLFGGCAGIVFARWLTPMLQMILADSSSGEIPGLSRFEADPFVVAFAVAVSIVTGLLFGIFPALQISRLNLSDSLRRTTRLGGRQSVSSVLAGAEVALAALVLISAGLLLRSFERLLQVDPGIRTDHLLTAQINLAGALYRSDGEAQKFFDRLIGRLKAVPGITSVATVNSVVLRPHANLTRFAIEGQPRPEPGKFPVAQIRVVSPGYFDTMGIRILAGRPFNKADVMDPKKEYFIINESMAKLYFPGQDPIGKNILMGVTGPQLSPVPIVGLAADAKELGVENPAGAEIYLAGYGAFEFVMIRTAVDPLSVAPTIRREVMAIDPDQPVAKFETMEDVLVSSLARRRYSSLLLGAFALVALALAALGTFGIVSYSVSLRTREFGVRLALGARPADLFATLFRQSVVPAAIGLAIGLAAAIAASRLLHSLLFGVSPFDVTTLGGVTVLLLTATFLAVLVPARRAMRVDPAVALRCD